MNKKEFVDLIRDTFPEDFVGWDSFKIEKPTGLTSDMLVLFETSRNPKGEEVSQTIEYILVNKSRKIIRIDRHNGGAFSIKNVQKLNVYIDIIDKLTMKPTVRLINPEALSYRYSEKEILIVPGEHTVCYKDRTFTDRWEVNKVMVDPIRNHVLIYRSTSAMPRNDISKILFPTKTYKENNSLFSPVEILEAVKKSSDFKQDFFKDLGFDLSSSIVCPLGLGQEGCIIRYEGKAIIIAVQFGLTTPLGTIIFPDGTTRVYDLKNLYFLHRPFTIPVNVNVATNDIIIANYITDVVSYGATYFESPSVRISNQTIVLTPGVTVAI